MGTKEIRNFGISLVLSAMSVLTPYAVLAQPASSPHEAVPAGDPIAIYKEAGINAEQEGKIRDLVKVFEDQQKIRISQMMGLLKELRALSQTPDPDENIVLAKQDEINKLHDDIATERVKLMLKIRYTMTPDQRQKLVALVKKQPAHSSPNPEAVK
jgi:Spy/CpxP family protein refolding chaperone